MPRATAGDDRDADGGGNRGGQLDVITSLGSIRVHAREQNLPRPAPPDFLGPFHRIKAHRRAAAMGVNSPFARTFAFRVDGDDDALAAEGFRTLVDETGIHHRGGVHTDLVRPGQQHFPHVIHAADAAADGQRNEALFRRPADDIDHRVAVVRGGGDVEEDQLVRLLQIVGDRALDRISGVDEIDEIDALDYAAGGDVEAGNNSFREHVRSLGTGGITIKTKRPAASRRPGVLGKSGEGRLSRALASRRGAPRRSVSGTCRCDPPCPRTAQAR